MSEILATLTLNDSPAKFAEANGFEYEDVLAAYNFLEEEYEDYLDAMWDC